MFTSLFRKSTPLNYSIVILGVVLFYFLVQIHFVTNVFTSINAIEKIVLLAIIFGSIFTTNFIVKKNGLSKDSAYTVFFYFLLLLFFPNVWNNKSLLLSNFFILLAIRRLVSLQSLKTPKEKIFDASLWVFVAAMFHFWSIIYIILVFIAILFHAARDYRNWFLPFIAFFTSCSVFVLFALIFDKSWISQLLSDTTVNYKIDYFVKPSQNLALSVYTTIGLYFVLSLLMSMSKRPLMLHTSYKKVLWAFFRNSSFYSIHK
ncbi:hypothetical protein ACFQZF_03325 [Flavobacterium myungsuense]|uniref:hypothetical protein n=1 Tax=Flavobacterium myungsuense TaxID=651823 RepID=UPI0036270750